MKLLITLLLTATTQANVRIQGFEPTYEMLQVISQQMLKAQDQAYDRLSRSTRYDQSEELCIPEDRT